MTNDHFGGHFFSLSLRIRRVFLIEHNILRSEINIFMKVVRRYMYTNTYLLRSTLFLMELCSLSRLKCAHRGHTLVRHARFFKLTISRDSSNSASPFENSSRKGKTPKIRSTLIVPIEMWNLPEMKIALPPVLYRPPEISIFSKTNRETN